ncbi:MAG: hypothetical protein AVDCRST_MAG89-2591, partial [uncultured Gemmatimonadetes bacterium]
AEPTRLARRPGRLPCPARGPGRVPGRRNAGPGRGRERHGDGQRARLRDGDGRQPQRNRHGPAGGAARLQRGGARLRRTDGGRAHAGRNGHGRDGSAAGALAAGKRNQPQSRRVHAQHGGVDGNAPRGGVRPRVHAPAGTAARVAGGSARQEPDPRGAGRAAARGASAHASHGRRAPPRGTAHPRVARAV